MKRMERRLQKVEKVFLPAPETASDRELLRRIEAGRRRVQQDRPAHGVGEPSDEGLPLREPTSRGLQRTIDVLHEGRQRNYLHWLREKKLHVSGPLAIGDYL